MRRLTGFEFGAPDQPPETPALSAGERELLYDPVKEKLARVYPQFAARSWPAIKPQASAAAGGAS